MSKTIFYFHYSRFIQALQYNSEDNSWSWWLKGIKSGFADVSEEAGNFFTKYENKGKNLTQIMSNVSNNNGLDNFIRQNKLADESLIKFLGNANYAEKTLDNYKLYLKDTGQATSAFAGFTKKASTALKSFAASMASMATTWLIFEAIGLVFKAVDNWIHKAEYSREALEEVTKELDGTKSELTTINDKIAEIQAKGKLELTDKVELQKLESERSILEDQVKLLELKKELAANKSNKDAVDTANSFARGFELTWHGVDTNALKQLRILGYENTSENFQEGWYGSSLSRRLKFV